jgi:hypothetical protein
MTASVSIITDEDKLAERIALRMGPLLIKLLPQLIAEQGKVEDRDVSSREAARIARCRPETIAEACESGKLKSRATSRKTPSGAAHRLIRTRDLRAWIEKGMKP